MVSKSRHQYQTCQGRSGGRETPFIKITLEANLTEKVKDLHDGNFMILKKEISEDAGRENYFWCSWIVRINVKWLYY